MIERSPGDKIYLVGFMAAGKTTVGQQLAALLGWQFIDIDQLIEERERAPIAKVFAAHGEPYFRSVEREVLCAQVPLRHAVVATGGGTFVDPSNRALIQADGISVWLDVPFDVLLTRLPTDGRRPLAFDRSQLTQLFQARRTIYAEATIRIDAGRQGAEAVLEMLADRLRR